MSVFPLSLRSGCLSSHVIFFFLLSFQLTPEEEVPNQTNGKRESTKSWVS